MKKIPKGRPKTGRPPIIYDRLALERPVNLIFRQLARQEKKTYSEFIMELLEMWRINK